MADDLSSLLSEIRERAHELTIDLPQEEHCGAVPCTGHDALRLLAAVEAALKLHKPHVRRQNWPPVCSYDNRRWPCPEVAAITAALAGEEAGE